MNLQLPPALEESPSKELALLGEPVVLLLRQATERLRRLCPVADLRLGSVIGRGEEEDGVQVHAACKHTWHGGAV